MSGVTAMLTIPTEHVILPDDQQGGVNVRKQTKRKQTKRSNSFKLKGVISKGEHLSLEEREAAFREALGSFKPLDLREEEDFGDLIAGERDEGTKEEGYPVSGN